jgi:hypothetical protein
MWCAVPATAQQHRREAPALTKANMQLARAVCVVGWAQNTALRTSQGVWQKDEGSDCYRSLSAELGVLLFVSMCQHAADGTGAAYLRTGF